MQRFSPYLQVPLPLALPTLRLLALLLAFALTLLPLLLLPPLLLLALFEDPVLEMYNAS